MRIACILITLDRPDLTLQVIRKNFFNAEQDADVFLVDNGSDMQNFEIFRESYPFTKVYRFTQNKGISHAINQGILMAEGYDGVATLANDILMPKGWLRLMNNYAEAMPNTGIAGIHCVEQFPPLSPSGVHEYDRIFGNVLITRTLIDKIGGYNIGFDPYGMQDSEYSYRAAKCGFTQFYIPDVRSEHIGHDVGQVSKYRKMKDEGLSRAEDIYNRAIKHYDATGNYYQPL